MFTRVRRTLPAALAAGACAVLLATSPASAATITQINVSTSAIPRGANCVYITAEWRRRGPYQPRLLLHRGRQFPDRQLPREHR